MKTRVSFGDRFTNKLDRLERKYPSVTDEVGALVERLTTGERPGDKIPNIGYDVYKVGLKNPSARRGKRGGFRAIYYIHMTNHVILLTIYAKSQQEDISPEQIQRAIADIKLPDTENHENNGES